MAVQQRGGGRYRVLYRDADGIQRSGGTFATKREADDAYTILVGGVAEARQAARKAPIAPVKQRKAIPVYRAEVRGQMTVATYAPIWQASHQCGERCRGNYDSILRTHVLAKWGNVALGQISRAEIQTWMSSLGKDKSWYTLAQIRTTMSAMLGTAERDGLIPENPVRGIKLPRRPERRSRAISADQFHALLEAMPAEFRLLTRALWATGMRWGEVLALGPADISGNVIHVHATIVETNDRRLIRKESTKTGESRYVVVSPEFADELRGALPFPAYSRNDFRHVWNRALEKAGLEGVRRHDLRHSHATILANGIGGDAAACGDDA